MNLGKFPTHDELRELARQMPDARSKVLFLALSDEVIRLRGALHRIADYPKSRADELGVAGMREVAKAALDANPLADDAACLSLKSSATMNPGHPGNWTGEQAYHFGRALYERDAIVKSLETGDEWKLFHELTEHDRAKWISKAALLAEVSSFLTSPSSMRAGQ